MLRILLIILLSTPAIAQQTDPVELVNSLMGTKSKMLLSNGNTYPAIALPWGMNFWSPQTGRNGNGWQYSYDSDSIVGIKQTHQPSPWINDYGQFSLMPVTGKKRWLDKDRHSWFSHKSETAKPYYYSVFLADHGVTAEVTPTERSAQFRFTYPQTEEAWLVLDAFENGSEVRVFPKEQKITGYTTRNSGGVPANFKNYFVLYFDKPFSSFDTWDGKKLFENQALMNGEHAGAIIGFRTKKGEKVNVRVASSFISLEQAELNLQREIGQDNFEATKEKARSAWNRELSRIEIEGGTDAQRRTFYSCLYRVLLFPRSFYELDKTGAVMHYSPYNGEVRPGYMYTDNGFWDTFRAVFPFFTVMYPKLDAQIMEGLANAYDESGWLPEWASPGHRDCMIGSNSASLIGDAYLKGIRGYDVNKLYEAMQKNSENAGPLGSVGRLGAKYYNELGYVPSDVGINESAARTLEYAYADYVLWKMAVELKRPQAEVDRFAKRCQNYRNVFDPESKLMRGRNKDGSWHAPFSPTKWGGDFTEGNSWHYTWSVFQDVAGLSNLMGGRKQFEQMLDSVFAMPPVFDESYYGFVIHEIREMQIMNMGQYAHGNQPIQHMIYLYNQAGAPWKAQYWLRQVMDRLYAPTPDGYCGDEDNGQTSAWYVFSALGFYPVCPGSGEYVLGTPLFDKATLHLENGKTFTVEANGVDEANIYLKSAQLNGQNLEKTFIRHDDIQKGGRLQFEMEKTPNKDRGTRLEDLPYSFSKWQEKP